MQTYVFTVVVQGEDVQDAAESLREAIITMAKAGKLSDDGVNIYVTESARASDG